jgi:hypothetical protein
LLLRQPKLVPTHSRPLFGSHESEPFAHANNFMGPDLRVAGRKCKECGQLVPYGARIELEKLT